ncbi:iron-containing alcohol dehydrogenase [Amycolatopsis sp. NPDC051061]|uniref:iron-containing alcohol dehydrogenase n=1 Tax=Amycolatopsis sp. NPDC051061 TaxID=3155042 RepID=UPI00342B3C7D
MGHARVFVVTDRGLRATGIVERVERILAAAGIEHAVHEDVGPNPSTGAHHGRHRRRDQRFGVTKNAPRLPSEAEVAALLRSVY